MTLAETLLQKLSSWRPSGARSNLSIDAGSQQPSVVVTADHNDALACKVWEMQLHRKQDVGDVKAWAERVANEVTGLLEPLHLLELDIEGKTAQLRSEEPSRRGDSVLYYEVLLNVRGQAVVRRFQAMRDGSKKREQVGFVLTHEALAKLVDDLAS